MPETVITIVGNMDDALENRAAALVRDAGVGELRIDRLDPGHAVDILVNPYKPTLTDLLRRKLAALPGCDVFVQPNDAFRRKKLLIADMDATMVRQETLDELADQLGIRDKIAPITERAMKGEIDFYEALRQRVLLLRGLPVAAIHETIGKMEYSPGADVLVKTMRRHGARCVLVSGGFEQFTGHVAEVLGFHKHLSNRLGIEDQKLTGEVTPPIVDKHFKETTVTDQAKAAGCDVRHVVAVGDGANDIPMLQKAGTGVGYFGKPAVVAATPHQIRHTGLASILYMQGYRRGEITS